MLVDEGAVVAEVAEDGAWVGVLEGELGLSGAGWVFQEGLDVAQSGVPVLLGFPAGVVDGSGGVFFRESAEAHDGAQGGVAASVDEVLCPESAGGTQEGGAVGPVFDGGGDGGGHAGAAECAAEGAGLETEVGADGFATLIEDAHHAKVPADPDFVADVLGGDFIIGAGDFHEAVAADFAPSFFEDGEEGGGKRLQKGALLGEVLGDLAFGGAVDARVGDGFFPMGEVGILGGETLEVVAFERAVFDIADAAFDFALVLGRVGTAWHDARAVVSTEGLKLGIDLGIEPVGA